MKKIAAITAAAVFCLTGCSGGPDGFIKPGDIKNISARPHVIEEYYEQKELLADDYIYIENFRCIDDNFYYTGRKMHNEARKCIWQSSDDHVLSSVDLNFSYINIWDACFADSSLYVLHDDSISRVDTVSGNILNTVKMNDDCIQICCYSGKIYAMNFSGTLFFFDMELESISSSDACEMTGISDDDLIVRQFLVNDDGIYLWGYREAGNSEIPVLFALDHDYKLRFSREYADLSGIAYEIYEDDRGIVLVSYENNADTSASCSFVDIVSPEDGNIMEWYEVPDAQFLFWNYDRDQVVGSGTSGTFIYDLKSGTKKTAGEEEGFLDGRNAESDGIFFSFSDCDSEVVTAFSTVDSEKNKKEQKLEENVPFSGVDGNGRFYTAEFCDNREGLVCFYDGGKKHEISISPENDQLEMDLLFYCTGDRIYNVAVDQNYTDNILVFDMDGRPVSQITLNDGAVLRSFSGNGKSTYVLTDEAAGESRIYRITESGTEMTDIPESLKPERIYDGDDEYDFYFCSGVVIYGYSSSKNRTDRIMNYVDSGIVSQPEQFVRTGKCEYACSTDEGIAVCRKADQETLDRLNSRRIIYVAGDSNSLSEEIRSKIVEFNRNSMDYFIVSKNYSADMRTYEGKLISELYDDIIKGNIPDIYLLSSSFDYSFLQKADGFLDLKKVNISSGEIFENASEICGYNGEEYGAAPAFAYTGIGYTGSRDLFADGCTYDEFLETARKYDLKFSADTDPFMLYYYFAVNHASDFIDQSSGKCHFNDERFISMLEYIRDAYSEDGELVLADCMSTADFEVLRNIRLFDFSEDGKSRGRLTRINGMAVSAFSEVSDGAAEFLKIFFDEEYQENGLGGIPVSREVFRKELELSDKTADQAEKILDSSAEAYESDGCIISLIMSSADGFLSGNISAAVLADTIQQQVSLYLKETS